MFSCRLPYSKRLRLTYVNFVVFLLLSLGVLKNVQASERYRFNIPAMQASKALDKLAEVSGYSLLYPFSDSVVIMSNPLVGSYSIKEALATLLLNTPLNAVATDKQVIAVSATLDHNKTNTRQTSSIDTLANITSQRSKQNKTTKKTKAERIQIIGSRRNNRSPSGALAPLDVISNQELASKGSNDIITTLSNIIPSYNARQEAISDAGTMVRPANLRGLPTDSMLVLVNGKRRHRSGVIYEFISGLNVGAHGVDLEPIPSIALKSVEILRDGATAQYGSDAIAGVINFRLEDSATIQKIEMRTGQYYAGDGAKFELAGILGTNIGDEGSANFSFEFSESEATSRGIQDPAVQQLIETGVNAADIRNPVVDWGAPEITGNIKLFSNMAFDVSTSENYKQLYVFGNWAQRDVDGSFFYRNPNTRANVYTNPQSGTRLFYDMTSNNTGNCPTPTIPGSEGDAEALAAVAENNNCFAFNELFPGGFTPRFGGRVTDASLAAGIRGAEVINDVELTYDMSMVFGKNEIDYQLHNSVNASLGELSPTSFELGSQIQTEAVLNADFTYPIDLGFESELNVAFGYQHHLEQFEVVAGDRASYQTGPFTSEGEAIGANGFPGFSPETAEINDRNSNAFYLDVEGDITEAFSVSLAMRYEDIGEIGDTLDGKLSARLQIDDNIALRSTISNGFRAPTVGQSTLQRISTSNSIINDVVVQQRSQLVSALSPIASARSGGELEPEKATSFGVGLLSEISGINITLDYFYIDIDDRISLFTSKIVAADAPLLVASEVQPNVSNIQYYANDFNSITQGVDLVASLPFEFEHAQHLMSFAFNYTDTQLEVTNPKSPIANENVRKEREHGVPKTRAIFTYSLSKGDIKAMARINYYGSFYNAQFNDVTLLEKVNASVITDVEISYNISDNLNIAIGAKNIFDVYPEEYSEGRKAGFLGAIYPVNSPAGFNGGQYYLHVGWKY
ncbi:TonB-dependent receptor [Thalassotalea sp. 1_MG-2023]|uniref:TonB-dependent receptor plug domain-containing protein n=1 Tax=Thalassotalea sp. 1_MG-2023 TaxID=3062680 RepID=UPI0026E14AD6|nr:TonB-dependent receptor [Thalassotalea sp. 1_MG-2023]MDO6426778.1 TonB-dependent receptor [Thalassotalea sp. 1_MG-2023]